MIRFIQKHLQYSYFFGRRVVCAQTAIFIKNRSPKNAGTMFGWWFGVFQRVRNTGLRRTLADFFIQQKCASEQEERILYNPPAEKCGDGRHFCIQRLSRTLNLLKSKSTNLKKLLTSYPGPTQWYHNQVYLIQLNGIFKKCGTDKQSKNSGWGKRDGEGCSC